MTRSASCAVLLVCSVFPCVSSGADDLPTHDELAGKPALKANVDDLKRTIIVPTLDARLPENTNVIYCSTFQLAWLELKNLMGEGELAKYKSRTVAQLNRSSLSKEDHLDKRSYVAVAGYGPELIERVRRELDEKFKGQASPELLPSTINDMPTAYAYLFRALPFRWAFHRFERPLSFKGRPVESWGISQLLDFDKAETLQASQVIVHSYVSALDFVIELKVVSQDDRLILARVPAQTTAKETIASIRQRISQSQPTGLER